jgi:hypothetical protein
VAEGGNDKPPALQAAERARASAVLRTAHIELFERSTVGFLEGKSTRPFVQYYTWKCAGDEHITVRQGDEEGVVMRDSAGRPRDDMTYRGPWCFLAKRDEVWDHVQDDTSANVWSSDRTDTFRLLDWRMLGLSPFGFAELFDDDAARFGGTPVQYDSVVEDGLHVVTASAGDSMFRWWIDPERGWNVVRTGVWRRGQQLGDVRFALRDYDGVWFPERMERFRLAAGDTEPSTVISILSAEFNRPYHPQRLTPADIGVEPGTNLTFQDSQLPLDLWDGEKAVTAEDFLARVKSGELKQGPTVAREIARRRAQGEGGASQESAAASQPGAGDSFGTTQPARAGYAADPNDFVSRWETYTRRFIVKYRLNEDQARRAWEVCRTCEEQGREYLSKRSSEFEEWQKRLDGLKNASAEERQRELPRLDQRCDELVAPIDRIFEQKLKPRLDRLPTAAQREAVEPSPESRPAAHVAGAR